MYLKSIQTICANLDQTAILISRMLVYIGKTAYYTVFVEKNALMT